MQPGVRRNAALPRTDATTTRFLFAGDRTRLARLIRAKAKAVITDDLSTPLGQGPRKKPRSGFGLRAPLVVAGALALIALLFVLWTAPGGGLYRDRTTANAPIESVPPVTAPANDTATVLPHATTLRQAMPAGPSRQDDTPTGSIPDPEPKVEPGMTTVTIIDGSSGKRRKVLVRDPGAETAPGGTR
jgi:hypothetical protein